MYLKLGFAAFIITFGLQFAVTTEIGLLISWIGAAAIVAGAILEDKAGDTAAALHRLGIGQLPALGPPSPTDWHVHRPPRTGAADQHGLDPLDA